MLTFMFQTFSPRRLPRPARAARSCKDVSFFRGLFVFFSGADWFFDTIMGLWDGHVMALRFLFFSSISWLYIMSTDME